MNTFKSKEVIVMAIQFDGSNHKECVEFIGCNFDSTVNYPNITTSSGSTMEVIPSDYIVKFEDGSILKYSQSDFVRLYCLE